MAPCEVEEVSVECCAFSPGDTDRIGWKRMQRDLGRSTEVRAGLVGARKDSMVQIRLRLHSMRGKTCDQLFHQ